MCWSFTGMYSQGQALQERERLGSGWAEQKLNGSAAASEALPYPIGSLGVGMTLQRCPRRMYRARAFYHQLPPLIRHCSTAFGGTSSLWPKGTSKRGCHRGFQQTFPAAERISTLILGSTHSFHHYLWAETSTV